MNYFKKWEKMKKIPSPLGFEPATIGSAGDLAQLVMPLPVNQIVAGLNLGGENNFSLLIFSFFNVISEIGVL